MAVAIHIINTSTNPLPTYATVGSSGVDVQAYITNPIILQPQQRTLIPTGLQLSIPLGYEVQVRPRSGLALKHGITCLNAPGTIDSDYRGEVQVLLINHSTEPYTIHNGDKIAQLVAQKIEHINWNNTEHTLDATIRQAGGFGHTGI